MTRRIKVVWRDSSSGDYHNYFNILEFEMMVSHLNANIYYIARNIRLALMKHPGLMF